MGADFEHKYRWWSYNSDDIRISHNSLSTAVELNVNPNSLFLYFSVHAVLVLEI